MKWTPQKTIVSAVVSAVFRLFNKEGKMAVSVDSEGGITIINNDGKPKVTVGTQGVAPADRVEGQKVLKRRLVDHLAGGIPGAGM